MSQPDNFGFGEEPALLKRSARKLFEEKMPVDRLHSLVADDPTPERMPPCRWDEDLWREMVELGWTLLALPEEAGGVGMPAVAVAGLAEELGRAAVPCPLLPTLNASYVLSESGEGAADALAEIAAGLSATLAITDAHGSWDAGSSGVVYRDGKLEGVAWYVQDARKVDRLLVSAHDGEDLSLFWVQRDAAGVTIAPDALVDLTRDQAHVRFEAVSATPVCGKGADVLERAFPSIWTVSAAEMVGAAEWQLQTTVDYVGARSQFDKPLGFFQAVKHPLVNVMIDIDQAKSLVYNAACAIDSEPERAARFAHMAKAAASDAAGFASGRSVQCHGGIGFTWECHLHLYFKRQKHSQMLWGDGAWHRGRLADLMM